MSFGSQPSPMIVPQSPAPAPQMSPSGEKPKRKPMQPTFISDALNPATTGGVTGGGGRSLLGGTTQ